MQPIKNLVIAFIGILFLTAWAFYSMGYSDCKADERRLYPYSYNHQASNDLSKAEYWITYSDGNPESGEYSIHIKSDTGWHKLLYRGKAGRFTIK